MSSPTATGVRRAAACDDILASRTLCDELTFSIRPQTVHLRSSAIWPFIYPKPFKYHRGLASRADGSPTLGRALSAYNDAVIKPQMPVSKSMRGTISVRRTSRLHVMAL